MAPQLKGLAFHAVPTNAYAANSAWQQLVALAHTWDIPLGFTYERSAGDLAWLGSVNWGFQATGKIRTGQNSRGYRLGNRLVVGGSVSTRPIRWLSPSFGIYSESCGDIRGNDLNFPGPIYPTPVADPMSFGGQRVSVTVGLECMVSGSDFAGQSVEMTIGVPVHQDLNGPQPQATVRADVSWNLSF